METLKKQSVLLTGLALAVLFFLVGWELQQPHTPIQLESSLSLGVSGVLMIMTALSSTAVAVGLASRRA